MKCRGKEIYPVINDNGFVIMLLEEYENQIKELNVSIPMRWLKKWSKTRSKEEQRAIQRAVEEWMWELEEGEKQ